MTASNAVGRCGEEPLHDLSHVAPIAIAAESSLPTRHGPFRIVVFRHVAADGEHVALVREPLHVRGNRALVRLHFECLAGDVFHSLSCECDAELDRALALIDSAGAGVLVYLRTHELAKNIHAAAFDSDICRYDAAVAFLRHLGFRSMELLTNDPREIRAMVTAGFDVASRPLFVQPNERED